MQTVGATRLQHCPDCFTLSVIFSAVNTQATAVPRFLSDKYQREEKCRDLKPQLL